MATMEASGGAIRLLMLAHTLPMADRRREYLEPVAKVHLIERRQRVDLPIEGAFGFYGDAHNLERITPPWLGFEVTTPGRIEMEVGTSIEYRLRLHGVPVRWQTRITAWEPPRRFVDVQVKGPYSLWEHTHWFEEDGPKATIIEDRVRYSIPFGPLGDLAERLLVRRDLRQIFDYRREAVARELRHR
jgi:ligand-binding SRPBCC domain-containing protein